MRLQLHLELKKMLIEEMQRRGPGFLIKFDGTFRVASRLKVPHRRSMCPTTTEPRHRAYWPIYLSMYMSTCLSTC